MKLLLPLFALLSLATVALADTPKFLEPGDRVQIQAVQPLQGEVSEVKVLEVAKDWVLVEFEKPARQADGSVGKASGKLWINFSHVVSVRKIESK